MLQSKEVVRGIGDQFAVVKDVPGKEALLKACWSKPVSPTSFPRLRCGTADCKAQHSNSDSRAFCSRPTHKQNTALKAPASSCKFGGCWSASLNHWLHTVSAGKKMSLRKKKEEVRKAAGVESNSRNVVCAGERWTQAQKHV